MKRLLAIFAAVICITTLAFSAYTGPAANNVGPAFEVQYLDAEVIADDDVIRVSVNLVGRPHTAGRIDSVYMVSSGSAELPAVDIDGVDFKRWFQWEDDSAIYVEIDFLGKSLPSDFELQFFGPRGTVKCKPTRAK